MHDIAIIGIGNPIKSDDGVGVMAVRYLEGRVPERVELVEGSVYCADLFHIIEGCRKVIFIDGIDAGEEPGAVFRFTPEEVRPETAGVSISLHDFGIYELITAARLMDQCPDEITIFAVQVKSLEFGEELSPEVEEAVPTVCRLILDELEGANG